MSAKSNTKPTSTTTDEELLAMLLNGSAGTPAPSVSIKRFLTDAASSSLNTSAAIGGALAGAWGNAKQAFTLEANFRAAERQVQARKEAEYYLARLKELAQS